MRTEVFIGKSYPFSNSFRDWVEVETTGSIDGLVIEPENEGTFLKFTKQIGYRMLVFNSIGRVQFDINQSRPIS